MEFEIAKLIKYGNSFFRLSCHENDSKSLNLVSIFIFFTSFIDHFTFYIYWIQSAGWKKKNLFWKFSVFNFLSILFPLRCRASSGYVKVIVLCNSNIFIKFSLQWAFSSSNPSSRLSRILIKAREISLNKKRNWKVFIIFLFEWNSSWFN